MATFGHTTPGTTISTAVSADRKVAFQNSMPEDGAITDLSIELQNDGTDIQVVRAGLYGQTAGVIGELLGISADQTLAPLAPKAWVTFQLLNAYEATMSQVLYLCIHFGTTGGNIKYWVSAGGTRIIASDIFADGLSNPWGVSTTSTDSIDAMYATYTPSAVSSLGIHKQPSIGGALVYGGVA